MQKNEQMDGYILQGIKRASEKGVLLFKNEKPATIEQIIGNHKIKEDFYYDLEFIVKDENGNLTEMWFADDKDKENKKSKRNDFRKDKGRKTRSR